MKKKRGIYEHRRQNMKKEMKHLTILTWNTSVSIYIHTHEFHYEIWLERKSKKGSHQNY